MKSPKADAYQKIAQAIEYITTSHLSQPNLDEIANHLEMSSFHFQRLFSEWAGISPKKFLQFISLGHAKHLLKNNSVSLFDTAFEVGLSGTGRLHDLFVNIEKMTPGDYKNGGESLQISYSISDTLFGKVLIASTGKGICYLAFISSEEIAIADLKKEYPKAHLFIHVDTHIEKVKHFFDNNLSSLGKINLHLKGTDFQLKVWEALLKIPKGQAETYGNIAERLDSPQASRAVGTAVGSNPIAYIIPCHRVIKSTGITGEYMWGATRKKAILGWESSF